MPQAIIVTLEKDLSAATLAATTAPGAKGANGKALARELDKLDYAARCCNVDQPSSLLSENPAAMIEKLKSDGFDPSKMRIPSEQWFDAAQGLKTVRALVAYVSSKLNDFKQPNPILRDLKAAEATLAVAHAAGVKFHFTKLDV